MRALFERFVREDKGQDLIEYALLAAGLSLAVVGSIGMIGAAVNTKYNQIGGVINPHRG